MVQEGLLPCCEGPCDAVTVTVAEAVAFPLSFVAITEYVKVPVAFGVTVTVPLQGFAPDQSPDPMQVVALVVSIVSCSEDPSVMVLVAGVILTVGVELGVTQVGHPGFPPPPLPTTRVTTTVLGGISPGFNISAKVTLAVYVPVAAGGVAVNVTVDGPFPAITDPETGPEAAWAVLIPINATDETFFPVADFKAWAGVPSIESQPLEPVPYAAVALQFNTEPPPPIFSIVAVAVMLSAASSVGAVDEIFIIDIGSQRMVKLAVSPGLVRV
jgi:hypothetical protein